MKILEVFGICLLCCSVFGCRTHLMNNFYSVSVKNIGSQQIYVERFNLNMDKDSVVKIGLVVPGGVAGWGPLVEMPSNRVLLKWHGENEMDTKQVILNTTVPKAFTAANRHAINIYINHDSGQVVVTFEVEESGEYLEFDSEGNIVGKRKKWY